MQPVEKISYDGNSSSIFKNTKRHQTELKGIKYYKRFFPLGFNDNTYPECNISKMPDFDVFSLLDIRKHKHSSKHGLRKKWKIIKKESTVKRSTTLLKV